MKITTALHHFIVPVFCTAHGFFCVVTYAAPSEPAQPKVVVVPAEEPTLFKDYRRTIVGVGVNEPDAYPGYAGFVGWGESVAITKSGAMVMTFSSGYWHGSPSTAFLEKHPDTIETMRKYGVAPVDAPRGGRAHFTRSEDGGRTWSKPSVLIDTPDDDRSPAVVTLSDGTVLASFFDSNGRVGILRSSDEGKTWDETPVYLPNKLPHIATNGPPVQLADGTVMLATYGGKNRYSEDMDLEIFRSNDLGKTWESTAILDAEYDLDEPHMAQVPDGRLAVTCRREGAIAWSKDGGTTWTEPVKLPFKMFDPWLLTLKDGTLVCGHGSYTEGKRGVRVILSPDGGDTWFAAGPDYGFSIDPTVYGYSRGIQLADGSIYLTYLYNGGHKPEHLKTEKILAIRFRVLDGCQGIELLPAPGSPADVKQAASGGGGNAK